MKKCPGKGEYFLSCPIVLNCVFCPIRIIFIGKLVLLSFGLGKNLKYLDGIPKTICLKNKNGKFEENEENKDFRGEK